jgi:hypothetical protein
LGLARSGLIGLFFAGLAGCADPCDGFCEAAAPRVAACLEERGLSYADAGFDGAGGWQNFCETWVWEQGVLGRAEAACARGSGLLDGGCEDVDAIWYYEE